MSLSDNLDVQAEFYALKKRIGFRFSQSTDDHFKDLMDDLQWEINREIDNAPTPRTAFDQTGMRVGP